MTENRIKILPEDLVNKIAAGEVVERPASVVKELIENSIDAGATQIMAEVQEAGKKLIRISDNGCGMVEEEIKIAFARHSTSKINSLEDLFNIKTLGFRGEALPSIASVSKTELGPNPSGQGITAEVKNLFYNTPARKKFLKSNATELGHIGDIVSKYTLAYPQIAFKFTSDSKPLLASPGTGKLIDAILAVYGPELVKDLIEVDFAFPAGRAFGFVSRPTLSRIDKNYESFFVNRRYVRNFLLNRALEEAYRTLIPNNRYPVGIIFIDIDPKQVDVNVHPTKREVRFVNNQAVMDAVTAAVKNALSNVFEAGSWDKGKEASHVPERYMAGMEVGSAKLGIGSFDRLPMTNIDTGILTQIPISNFQEAKLEITAVQPLIPIYQLKNMYIIATDGEELALIDQHAAHERIVYDQLNSHSPVPSSQSLLIPETVELSPSEAVTLLNNIDYLKELGFEIEEFGSGSYILRSVPAVSLKVPAKQLLSDIVSELRDMGKSVQLEVKRENIRKLVACHSAIKAGDKLTSQEMNQLIRDLYATNNPATCPHGRPTMIRVTEGELLTRFRR
jgi:DNA mismatch repair protein MutL